jgi:hypothetical protein
MEKRISSFCFMHAVNSVIGLSSTLQGSCTTGLLPYQSMGFEANKYGARGIFYLETRGAEPFCLG